MTGPGETRGIRANMADRRRLASFSPAHNGNRRSPQQGEDRVVHTSVPLAGGVEARNNNSTAAPAKPPCPPMSCGSCEQVLLVGTLDIAAT